MSWLSLLTLFAALDPTVSEATSPEEEGVSPLSELSVGVEVAVATTYVYRGEPQYTTSSVPSLQPSLWLELPGIGPGALQLELWSAFAMADWDRNDAEGMASEIDLGLFYQAELLSDWLQLRVGFVYYVYPHADDADGEKELMVELGLGNLPIVPRLELWTEVHPTPGVYIEPGITWEQQFGDFSFGTDLALGASAYHGDEATLDHATLTLSFEQGAGDLTVAFSLAYSILLAAGRGDFLERSLVYGAVAVRYEP